MPFQAPRQRTRLAVLVLAPPLVAVSIVALVRAIDQRPERPAGELLPSPDACVPFSADVVLAHGDRPDIAATNGRFYRASDGSTRLETWLANVPEITVFSIKHVKSATYYVKKQSGDWTASPMELGPDGWQPLKRRASMPGLTRYPHRLALYPGGDGSLTSETGFETYLYVDRRGSVQLIVPELNFSPMVRQTLVNGRRERYFNIAIGEPDPSLFLPPAGTSVTKLSEPAGITRRRSGVRQ